MYTRENLQQKNLRELKEIGWQLNVLPDGDRRWRKNWMNALVGVQPPLLQLLEVSPGVEPVEDAIEEVQAQEFDPIVCPECGGDKFVTDDEGFYVECPACNGSGEVEPVQEAIETPPGVESKFGCIVYPKPASKPIAQNAETRPQLDRTESADVHNRRSHPAESARDSSSAKAEALGSKEGDRVLALAGNSEADRGGVLPHQSIELAATFNDDQPPNRGDGKGGRIEPKLSQSAIVPEAKNHLDQEEGITLSSTFLARYSPPQPEIIRFQSDADGQLSLLDFTVETDDEPPDPDDFETLDAFREAIALWDAQHPELIEIGLDSFCEWAPCPDDWYEPEPSEVSEHSPTSESSSTCNFSIPTFDRWCDRTNRQTDTDEPPDTGNFARLPGPKPPKFPPSAIGQSHTKRKSNADQTHLNHISITSQSHNRHIVATGSSSRLGRSPPGGDVM